MRVIAAALLLLVSVVIAGCNGARETDELAWVIAIGIDKAGDGDLLVTYRIAVPAALSPIEGGAGAKDKQPSAAITIKAPTLAEARNLLNEVSSRSVNLYHVVVITVGEDLARDGLGEVLVSLTRSHEFRGTIFLNTCKGTAKELFRKNKPDIELFPTRWLENMTFHRYGETSFILPTTLHDFITRVKSETGAPYSMAVAINKPLNLQDKMIADAVPGSKEKEYLAGDIPREDGNPAENLGTAIYKEDRLVDFLSGEETRALAIVMNKFSRGIISINDPLLPTQAVDIFFRNGDKPDIDVDISGEVPVIHIHVYLEAEIKNIPSGIWYESPDYKSLLSAELSDVIKEQILRMLLHVQSVGADTVDFGYYTRQKFRTRNELIAYHWDERFRQAIFNVEVKTDIRRNGLMKYSSPIRREQQE